MHSASPLNSNSALNGASGQEGKKKNRNRSLSAPPLAWLLSASSSRSLSPAVHANTTNGGSFVVERKKRSGAPVLGEF